MNISVDQIICIVVGMLGALSAIVYKNIVSDIKVIEGRLNEAEKRLTQQENVSTGITVKFEFIAESIKAIQTDVAAIRNKEKP